MKEIKEAFLKGFREAWLDYLQPLHWLISKLVSSKRNEKLTAESDNIVWTISKILSLISLVFVIGSLALATFLLIFSGAVYLAA